MTMDVIGLTAFGTDLCVQNRAETDQHVIVTAAKKVFQGAQLASNDVFQTFLSFPFLAPLFAIFGRSYTRRQAKNFDVLDSTAAGIAERRMADPNWREHRDFLTFLLEAKDEAGLTLTPEEVRDQANLFLLAGYETTANTLCYSTLLLSQNPDVEARMLKEIDRLASSSSSSKDGRADPDFDDLKQYEYVEAVINESLRMYPPAVMVRTPNSNAKLAGKYTIPPGTPVQCVAAAVHFSTNYWDRPYEFRPERFLKGTPENDRRHKYAHIPFGAGPRMCIGYRFALEEAKLALIRIYRRFSFRVHSSMLLPLSCTMGVTLAPRTDVLLTVHPRYS